VLVVRLEGVYGDVLEHRLVDANSHGTYPIATGDYIYDQTADSEAGYTCTVAPTASTAGTFVKLHA